MGSSSLHFVFEDALGQPINPHEIFASTGLLLSSGGSEQLTLDSGSGSVGLAPGDSLSFKGSALTALDITLAAAEPTALRSIILPDADGEVVLDTASQALTNKSINGLALTEASDGFAIAGGVTSSTLTLTGGDITLAGGGSTINLGGNFTTSGANSITLTTDGTTAVTLPTSGTLATLSGSETLENKRIRRSTIDVRSADIGNLDSSFGNITQIVGTSASLELVSTGEMITSILSASGAANFTGPVTFTGTVTGVSADLTLGGDLNGNALILDADADTSITADTDDQIDFAIAGTDLVRMSAAASLALISDAGTAASGITFGTTGTTNLYRSATGTLTTDGRLTIGGSLSFGGAFVFSDDTFSATGGVVLGTTGTSANLYRSAGDTITTDDSFIVGGSLTLSGASTSVASGITFGTTGTTNLYRSASGTLTTDGRLTIGGSLSFGGAFVFSDDTFSATGGVVLGTTGTSANLYRSAGDTITTDDSFIVAGSLTVSAGLTTGPTITSTGSISIDTVGGTAGITFGGDTTLFRSAADTLSTGKNFTVGGNMAITGALLDAPTLTVTGSISLATVNGTSGITFGGDTTLFRSAANTLATGNDLTVNRSLTVSGGLFDAPAITSTGSISIETVNGTAGITFGGDSTLFRTLADTLSTGGSFTVGGSLQVTGAFTDRPTLVVTGSISLATVNGTSGITFGGDTTLFRSAANTLATGNDLTVNRSLTVSGGLFDAPAITSTGSISIETVNGTAGITFGGDSTLFRTLADTLSTGGSFTVGGSLQVRGAFIDRPTLVVTGSISLATVNGTSGITFGGDTTLFRSAANTLATGNDLTVGQDLTVIRTLTVSSGLIDSPAITSTGSISIETVNGTAGITFGGDATLFRSLAGTLTTGRDLTVGGSLIIGGSLLNNASASLTVNGSIDINAGNGPAGITFGGDTTLFRSAANTLATGNGLTVGQVLTVTRSLTVSGGLIGSPAITATGSISLQTVNGTAGITFGGDATLFRTLAGTLTTGQDLTVGGSLIIGGSLLNNASASLTVNGSIDINAGNGPAGITFGGDTTLFRSAANTLATGNGLTVGQDLTVTRSLTVSGGLIGSPVITSTGSISIETVNGTAGITFGGDTTLFRSTAERLEVGRDLTVGGSLIIVGSLLNNASASLTVTGSIDINAGNGPAGITFGGDTTLFRSGANTLATGNGLTVGQDLTVIRSLTVSGGLIGSPVITSTGSISIETVNGTAGITFGGDSTLFRSAGSELSTGGSFTVAASLTIGGAVVGNTNASLTVTGSVAINASNNGVAGITFGGDTTLFRSTAERLEVGQTLKVNGAFAMGDQDTLIVNDTTPSVAGASSFITNNTAGTLISFFDDGTNGQILVVELGDANTTWDCAATLLICGTEDIVTVAVGDTFIWFYNGVDWILISFLDISDALDSAGVEPGFTDLAEYFPASEALEPGDLVSVDAGFPVYVTKSSGAYQRTLLGVVSTDPAITFGDPTTMENPAAIALAGRVPVKVTNENGPVAIGDFLTSSSIPGYAMKATRNGRVIGMALDNFTGVKGKVVKGKVMMLVDNGFWQPSTGAEAVLSGVAGTIDLATSSSDSANTFSELFATSGKFTILGATTGVFGSLVAASAEFDDLAVSSGTFALLEATSATFEELQAASGEFQSLEADTGKFTNLVVIDGSFEKLEADSATFGSVEATEGLTVGEGGDTTTIVRHLSAAADLDFSLSANSCQDLTVPVDGAGMAGDTVAVGAPSILEADLSVTGFVSGADTVTVRLCNPTRRQVDPESGSYRVDVWQHR